MKNIAILAILGYISSADALKLQYDQNDVNKDITKIQANYKDVNTKIVRIEKWLGEHSDEDKKKEDNKEEDKQNDEDKMESSLPWVTQHKLESGCDAGYKRFMQEGGGRIKVESGKLFDDQSFPADKTAIHWKWNVRKTWKRPTEVEKSPSLWGSKGITPGDVIDAGFRDTWLTSVMAAIAEQPGRIEKIFNGQKSYPTNGQIKTNFWVFGKSYRVTIDDKIPFDNRNGKLVASYAK